MPDTTQTTNPAGGTTGTTPAAGSTNSTSKTTVAVGVSYNTTEARKFAFDASAMAEVTAELVGVPAPTELTRLLAERFKQPPKETTPPAEKKTEGEDAGTSDDNAGTSDDGSSGDI
jgi:hypothetical protein